MVPLRRWFGMLSSTAGVGDAGVYSGEYTGDAAGDPSKLLVVHHHAAGHDLRPAALLQPHTCSPAVCWAVARRRHQDSVRRDAGVRRNWEPTASSEEAFTALPTGRACPGIPASSSIVGAASMGARGTGGRGHGALAPAALLESYWSAEDLVELFAHHHPEMVGAKVAEKTRRTMVNRTSHLTLRIRRAPLLLAFSSCSVKSVLITC
ncbi:unnamed protein product [Urochloa humidicola]